MAHSKLNPEDLMSRLADVIRANGFEGTSMSGLARTAGLEKASLYHHFPGGKEEIVQAVVNHLNVWLAEHVLKPLQGADAAAKRVRAAAKRLQEFYGDGNKACTLDTLSLPAGSDSLRDQLKASAVALLKGFERAAKDSGMTAAAAHRRAEQALIEIEGSLIFARVVGDAKPFLRVMERLPAQLTVVSDIHSDS